MFDGVQSVFFFVFDVVEAANWYSKLLNLPVKYFNSDGEIKAAIIQVGRVEMFFHPADAKMSPGSEGGTARCCFRFSRIETLGPVISFPSHTFF